MCVCVCVSVCPCICIVNIFVGNGKYFLYINYEVSFHNYLSTIEMQLPLIIEELADV